MSTAERDEGTPDAEGGHRYFVHGTTRRLWRGDTIDPNRGSGDYGAGFYVFEDTSWGRQAAANWAQRKARSGDEPILVRVRIGRLDFEALDRQDVPAEAFTEVRRQYARYGLTGKQVIIGPVGRRGPDGERVPDYRLPLQLKFEGTGIAALTVDGVIAVR